jgi:hypothetical protein
LRNGAACSEDADQGFLFKPMLRHQKFYRLAMGRSEED